MTDAQDWGQVRPSRWRPSAKDILSRRGCRRCQRVRVICWDSWDSLLLISKRSIRNGLRVPSLKSRRPTWQCLGCSSVNVRSELLMWQESVMNEKSILAMTNSLFITRLCLDCKDQVWTIKSPSLFASFPLEIVDQEELVSRSCTAHTWERYEPWPNPCIIAVSWIFQHHFCGGSCPLDDQAPCQSSRVLAIAERPIRTALVARGTRLTTALKRCTSSSSPALAVSCTPPMCGRACMVQRSTVGGGRDQLRHGNYMLFISLHRSSLGGGCCDAKSTLVWLFWQMHSVASAGLWGTES